jgi:hypothetical protein
VCRVGIHQPNYAPWLGYFAKMAAVDVFVFLDDCQMPIGRSYASRVQIRGREGAEWMSVPVQRVSGEAINAVRFAEPAWSTKHLRKLQANYGRCPFFNPVMEVVRQIYDDPGEYLSAFNIRLIRALANYVGLAPEFYVASKLGVRSTGSQRLIDLVQQVGGTAYVSGAGGVNYQDPTAFKAAGVELELRVYHPIPYSQEGEFLSGMSLLDALFNVGKDVSSLLSYESQNSIPFLENKSTLN